MKKLILTISLIAVIAIVGCKKDSSTPQQSCETITSIEVVKDADGNVINNKLTLLSGKVVSLERNRKQVGNEYCF
jgi:hypothetical protein